MKIKLTAINDKAKVNVSGYQRGFRDLVREVGREGYKYFEQSTSGFHGHSITITQLGTAGSTRFGGPETIVGVLRASDGNKIYSYVNHGTGPRIIRARASNPMIFRVAYRPATRQGSLRGGKWEKYGPWMVRWEVRHATSPRAFDVFIQHALQAHYDQIAPKRMRSMARRHWR